MNNEKKINGFGLSIIIFLGTMVTFVLSTILSDLLRYNLKYSYGDNVIYEGILAIISVFIIVITKKTSIFTKREKQPKYFYFTLLPFFMLICYHFIYGISTWHSFVPRIFINFIFYNLLVGIYEELIFRGLIQNIFYDKYGKEGKQGFYSVIFTSVLFGLLHISNIGTGISALFQIIYAIFLGMLFGSIYHKTKNIWLVALLHGIYDLSIIQRIDIIEVCSNNLNISIMSNLILENIFLIIYLALIITMIWNKKSVKLITIIGLIASLIAYGTLYIHNSNKESASCTHYTEKNIDNYVTHYSHLTTYQIEDMGLKLYEENNKIILENVNTKEKTYLDYEYIIDYELIDNDTSFSIILSSGYEVYYQKFNKSNFDINHISNNFKKYILPNIEQLGYLTFDNSDYKVVYLSTTLEKFIIDEKDNLYLISKEDLRR